MNLKLEIEDKEKQLKQQRSLENSIEMSKSSINSTFENIFEYESFKYGTGYQLLKF